MKAETQKLKKGIGELGTQELRNGTTKRRCLTGFLSGFPDFLIHHFPAETQKLRRGTWELGTQEIRKAEKGSRPAAPASGSIPDFLSSKFSNSLSEFLSFGLVPFGFRLSDFLRISAFGFLI